MKFTCNRKDVYEALQTATRAVSARSTLPILGNILIEPGAEEVTLGATDLELAIRATFPARVEEAAPLTLPAKTLVDILGQLPDGELTVDVDQQTSGVLKMKRSRFQLLGLAPEEFPPLPEVQPVVRFQSTEASLHRMIRSVIMAVSSDDTRPILTGVLARLKEGRLLFAATDTHRLAVRSSPVAELSCAGSCNIPARALSELQRALDAESPAPVVVSFDTNQIRFEARGLNLVSRLIEGTFPNFERYIPQSHTKCLRVGYTDLLQAVKRAAVVARENLNRVILTTDRDQGLLLVSAEAGALGKAEEEIEVQYEGDEDISLVLNFKFITDVLAVREGETLLVEMTEPLSPVVLRPDTDPDYRVVVMPMERP